MAAGCEPPTRRRRRPLCVSTNPASTQRRAALTVRALCGAGGSLGGGGAGRTARLSNGRAPGAARGGAVLPLAGSGPRPPRSLSPLPPPPSLPPGAPRPASRLSLFLPPGSRRSGARRGWSRVAPAGPASPLLSQVRNAPRLVGSLSFPSSGCHLGPWQTTYQAEKRTQRTRDSGLPRLWL